MLNKLKNSLMNENQMYLHEKRVEVPKLTPEKWKQLFERLDLLPGLIVQVFLAPKDEFYATVLSVCNLALDEVTDIVAVLSDVDEDYLRENVGLNEIVDFLFKTIKRNRIDETAKNLKSLLPKMKR